jgi:hypothetical protein
MHDFWAWLATKETIVTTGVAGAAGATVLALTEWQGWRAATRHFIVGMICAIYIPEAGAWVASPFFAVVDLAPERQLTGGAFVTGVGAIFLVQYIVEFVRAAIRITKGRVK